MKLKNKILFITCLVSVTSMICAQSDRMSDQQAYSAFLDANHSFAKANETEDSAVADELYTQAILGYEKIITTGKIKNAGLYYNLANAYLLRGDLGRAILNYRRAEYLDRSNPDIQKNLAFARTQRIDKIETRVEQKVLSRLFFWHYDFSTSAKFTVTCICFAVVCLALTLLVWRPGFPAAKPIAVILGIVTLCLFTSVVVDSYAQANYKSGVITADLVTARQGDGPNYPEAFKAPLHTGAEFDLLEQRPGWLHIELADGNDAWIPDSAAELI